MFGVKTFSKPVLLEDPNLLGYDAVSLGLTLKMKTL
jgi:hypothetical protein